MEPGVKVVLCLRLRITFDSKSTECIKPGVNSHVNYRFWAITMCPVRFRDCNNVPLQYVMWIIGVFQFWSRSVKGQGNIWGNLCAFSQFFCEYKTTLQKKGLNKKTKQKTEQLKTLQLQISKVGCQLSNLTFLPIHLLSHTTKKS